MKKHCVGSKAVFGFLTAVMIGTLSLGATSALAGHHKKNYDEMVSVPAGKFIYGPVYAKQEVNLPAFKIDKYEVTNEQYAKVVKGFEYEPEKAHFPAVFVSEVEAEAYCEAVGKRLPSEEEWEKAARGTDGRLYPWGDEFDETAAVTKETTAEGQKAREVGSREKGKSPYGAMDMAGNVWEWTSGYEERYSILRGGSYYEEAWAAQTISTLTSIPDDGKEYIGFRCAKGGK
ncbi:MAG: formylglycine-generating enzyme family protein [Mariprofundaceae bacterium]